MKACITGIAGFIGSHLAARLLEGGWEVCGIDDYSTGLASNILNLERAYEESLWVVYGDVRDSGKLAKLVDQADVVFHLAASVGVKRVVERPAETLAVNIGGTETVLELAAKKAKRIFVFSTSEVYGKSTALPFREDADLVLGPSCIARWGYAASKLADEFLALAYHREKSLPVTVIRLFNTVGPGQVGTYGMLVPRFAQQAVRGRPLTVYGTGQQTRSFCHVDDVVDALLGLGGHGVGQVLNIGNPEEVSVLDLAGRMNAIAQNTAGVIHVPYEEAYGPGFEEMPRRRPCIDKIRVLTGWAPRRSLDTILRDVLQYEQVQFDEERAAR